MTVSRLGEGGSISLRSAGIRFGDGEGAVEALRDFDLTIAPGEFVSVLGPSGCGKSTLIGAIAGLTKLSAGNLAMDDQPVQRPGPERGVVFQHHSLLPWKTVFENVEFGPKLRGQKRSERAASVNEILRQVGLSEFRNHYPGQLSGGMQQRVNLARALVNRPRVLLMDEPFASLDAQTRLLMQELLLELWSRSRMTVVFVTHDIDEALFLADRVVVLSHRPAQVREELTVDLIRPRTPDTLTTVTFVGLKRRCLDLLRHESPHSAQAVSFPKKIPEEITESVPHEASV